MCCGFPLLLLLAPRLPHLHLVEQLLRVERHGLLLLLDDPIVLLHHLSTVLLSYVDGGQIDVLVRAEVLGDGDAVEVLADLAVVDGRDVEEEEEPDEEEDDGGQADPDQDDLPPPVVVAAEGDEWEEGVAEEEAEDEAEEVGVVVDPGQEAEEEEDGRDPDQLEDGHLGVLEHVPLVNHFHNATGQKAEMGAGRTNLGDRG